MTMSNAFRIRARIGNETPTRPPDIRPGGRVGLWPLRRCSEAYGFCALPFGQSVAGFLLGFPGGPVWVWFLSPQPMPGLYWELAELPLPPPPATAMPPAVVPPIRSAVSARVTTRERKGSPFLRGFDRLA